MIIIRRHILGIQLMTNPYQLIAADVDNSGAIDDDDFDLIRQLLLGNITEFPNNTSWRFVDADYVFPEPTNPWSEPFPEAIELMDVLEDVLDADFIGLKIGDLNGTADTWLQPSSPTRNREIFYLATEDVEVKAGQTYIVPITAKGLTEMSGIQGTFELEGIVGLDIHHSLLAAENIGELHLDEGYLTMSWFQTAKMREELKGNKDASEALVLFHLVVHVQRNGRLSEMIRVNSRYTKAEAYRVEGSFSAVSAGMSSEEEQVFDLELVFLGSQMATAALQVYQNTPNPFAEETLIGFDLPESKGKGELIPVSVTISDVSGRVVAIIKDDYAAGYNTIKITKQMFKGATGIFTYTVRAGELAVSKRMIVVE